MKISSIELRGPGFTFSKK